MLKFTFTALVCLNFATSEEINDQASAVELAYARYQFFKYLHNEEVTDGVSNAIFDINQFEEIDSFKQQDGKLSYLMNRLDKNPSRNNVYGLLDELDSRKHLDTLYKNIFPSQAEKELRSETLVTRARDYECLRRLNGLLDDLCGANGEYALSYTKYVVDFCETASEMEKEGIEHAVRKECDQAATLLN